MGHNWPGNIRELRNVLERAVIVAARRNGAARAFPPAFHLADRSCLDAGGKRKPTILPRSQAVRCAKSKREYIQLP